MTTTKNIRQARPNWKTFLVELLTIRAGRYVPQHPKPNVQKRD